MANPSKTHSSGLKYWPKLYKHNYNLVLAAFVFLLCSLSYLVGVHTNHRGVGSSSSDVGSSGAIVIASSPPCHHLPSKPNASALDFGTHHSSADGPANRSIRAFPPCDSKLTEYPVRGRGPVPEIRPRQAHIQGAPLSGEGRAAQVPRAGPGRLQEPARGRPAAGPRGSRTCRTGSWRSRSGTELGACRRGHVPVPRRRDHVPQRRGRLHRRHRPSSTSGTGRSGPPLTLAAGLVASWGAYLLSRDIIACPSPRGTHTRRRSSLRSSGESRR
ncbi:uncharacterized protein M6B38_316935 [Iris pallida]|uniref:Uncharacterized protein n=1 Tax=Iris pallida TaxID=29817 RepID=A0AAX6HFK0_IRIPA|nr:uncharacterized protein M6B38_316935 [Iris pallida]